MIQQAVASLFTAEPHPAPIYRLVVDGQDITANLTGRLIDLILTDNRGFEADQLDIRLDDSDGKLDLPPKGADIRLAIGWAHTGLVDKGTYTVDEVEHSGTPDTLSIRARSADLRGGLTTQRERSWHEVTLGEIVTTIAEENDLAPMVNDTLGGIYIEHIDQTNESAVNLLSRLAKDHDAITTVKDGKLVFIPASRGATASGVQLPTVIIKRESGDQHRFLNADRETYTSVKASYYDVEKGVRGEVTWGKEEDAAERKVPPPAPLAPVTGQYKDDGKPPHKSRAKALKEARKAWKALKANKAAKGAYIGVRSKYADPNLGVSGEVTYGEEDEAKKQRNAQRQAEKDAEKAAGTANAFEHSADNAKTLRHVYANKANAERAVRAEWRRLQRGMATFSITLCRGRAEVFPEIPAQVRGFKPSIDGTDWIITRVSHSLSESGFTTSLELEIKATEIPN